MIFWSGNNKLPYGNIELPYGNLNYHVTRNKEIPIFHVLNIYENPSDQTRRESSLRPRSQVTEILNLPMRLKVRDASPRFPPNIQDENALADAPSKFLCFKSSHWGYLSLGLFIVFGLLYVLVFNQGNSENLVQEVKNLRYQVNADNKHFNQLQESILQLTLNVDKLTKRVDSMIGIDEIESTTLPESSPTPPSTIAPTTRVPTTLSRDPNYTL